jgi:hypothetical protein
MQINFVSPCSLYHASLATLVNVPDSPSAVRVPLHSNQFLVNQHPWCHPEITPLVANACAFGVCSTNALADLSGFSRAQTLEILEECKGKYREPGCLIAHGGRLQRKRDSRALVHDYLPQGDLWQAHPAHIAELAAMPFIPRRAPEIARPLPFSGANTIDPTAMRYLPTTLGGVVQTHSILCAEMIGALVRTATTHCPEMKLMALSESVLRRELRWIGLQKDERKTLDATGASWGGLPFGSKGQTKMDVPDGWIVALRPVQGNPSVAQWGRTSTHDVGCIRIEVEITPKGDDAYRKLFTRLPTDVTVIYLVALESAAKRIREVAADFPQIFVPPMAPAFGREGCIQLLETDILHALDRAYTIPCRVGENVQLEASAQPDVFRLFRADQPVPLSSPLGKTRKKALPKIRARRSKRPTPKPQPQPPKPVAAAAPTVSPTPQPTPPAQQPGPVTVPISDVKIEPKILPKPAAFVLAETPLPAVESDSTIPALDSVPEPPSVPKPEPIILPEPAPVIPVDAPHSAVEPTPLPTPPTPPEPTPAPEDPCPFVLPPRHNKSPFDDGSDEWEEEQLRLHAQRQARQKPGP